MCLTLASLFGFFVCNICTCSIPLSDLSTDKENIWLFVGKGAYKRHSCLASHVLGELGFDGRFDSVLLPHISHKFVYFLLLLDRNSGANSEDNTEQLEKDFINLG